MNFGLKISLFVGFRVWIEMFLFTSVRSERVVVGLSSSPTLSE